MDETEKFAVAKLIMAVDADRVANEPLLSTLGTWDQDKKMWDQRRADTRRDLDDELRNVSKLVTGDLKW